MSNTNPWLCLHDLEFLSSIAQLLTPLPYFVFANVFCLFFRDCPLNPDQSEFPFPARNLNHYKGNFLCKTRESTM